MQRSRRRVSWLAMMLLVALGPAHADPGSVDPSFGDQGVVTTPIGLASHARDVVRQADGKLVVVGLTGDDAGDFTTRDFALVRYHADGSLDTSFGTGGVTVTDFGGFEDTALAAAIQPDGKILAAGWGWRFGASPNPFDIAVARYETDGSLDPTFGLGGLAVTPIGTSRSSGRDVVVQADGRIVVAGDGILGSGAGAVVARYLASGAPDPDFGTDSTFIYRPPGSDHARAHGVALLPDGTILVAGTARIDGDWYITLTRLLPGGTLDPTFGSGGIALGPETYSGLNRGNGIVLQPDGKILVAADASHEITRFNADGSLDTAFGTDGTTSMDRGAAHFGTRLQADGRIVTIGYGHQNHIDRALPRAVTFAIGRYLSDGTPDPSFGTDGIASPVVNTAFAEPRLLGAFGWATVAEGPNAMIAVGAAQHAELGFLTLAFEEPSHFAMIRLDTCPCPACFTCDGEGGCAPGPRAGCHHPTAAGKSTLKLQVRNGEGRVGWSWKKGEATNLLHLQDPTTIDDYALCVFGGTAPALLLSATAPAGGFCPTQSEKPCWKPLGRNPTSKNGFKYKDRGGVPEGLTAITMRPGPDGRAKVTLKGNGENLPLPPLPAPLPIRVQLQADHGRCWEAEFSTTGLKRNDVGQFKGKSD